MSDNNCREAAQRKRRVQTLKKLIIVSLFISILIPILLSAAAITWVGRLNEKLDTLAAQLEELTQKTERQQELLEELLAEKSNEGAGRAANAESSAGTEAGAGEKETMEELPEEEPAHRVYLTFDDGPSIYTQDILDILDRYDIKATFFVTGKENEDDREAIRRIADKGHSLGMHSYSHDYSEIYASEESFAEDFQKIQNYLYEITGERSRIYRFPGGSSNTVSDVPMENFAAYLESQKVRFFDWNASSGDGGTQMQEAETLVNNCMRGIEEREDTMILLHDSAKKRTTVEALPMIIENILALEDTVILPITEDTEPVQHIKVKISE